jgi:hypothetical protein
VKTKSACVLIGIFCAFLVISCSSKSEKPETAATRPVPTRTWTPKALGDISADRCLYYREAEDFVEKSGGEIDRKGGASGGKCLGNRWGAERTDYVSYGIELDVTSENTLLVWRVAFEGKESSYDILVDGSVMRTATLSPTGGFGYTDAEWKCVSVPLGRIMRGHHTLTFKPVKSWQAVNIDCFALGSDK